ncbi:hypothetical protein BT93_A1349 [Corymbia citriodora subsp. variegata]|nr:hypothetical protein BT93_A1349 [Corymbia citriodora subsp. variegata]
MEALAQLQQEGEECNLKVEVGLLRKQSTTRKYGVDEGGVSGNANSSTTSSRTSFNGTHAEEEPEAEREYENNGGENGKGDGTESIQTIVKTEYSHSERVSYETETVHETSKVTAQNVSAFPSSQVDHQERGISGDERLLDLASLSPRKSSEVKNTYSKESEVVEEVDPIELNPEETEFDVEKVLEEQNTHDLYCPNCHSCITGRVILRRKKPSVGSFDIPKPRVNGSHSNTEREYFRCLSCFSIFIRTVVCWPCGDGKVQDPSEPQPSKGQPGEGDDPAQEIKPPQIGTRLPHEVLPVVQVPQPRQPREWDILKSIVYGGLIESITSLGVVSSAAGAGAATLNTLGLGLANLFGGLLVIAHNLRELKKEQPGEGTEQGGRYGEVLGKRWPFALHATVAILSFIIFGCVAPITYAFSFRESDNRDYKLAAVAGASLFCIFLLAIGKAHVGKPPPSGKTPKTYFETVLLYVVMGLMASGVSFLVGELIDELLTKLGWFDTTSSLSGTRPLETGSMQSGWASY